LFTQPPKLTQSQAIDREREQRVSSREPIDYSYTIFWTKTARLWPLNQRSSVAKNLETLINSADFKDNPFDRHYMLDGVEGSHSGASLIALKKVLEALNNER
ncbi:MAG TPA: hypothetical protein VFF70_11230, partial [Anaerolineae bacterium]|nr:hypothetical protein [Anaerolineae bacterium]